MKRIRVDTDELKSKADVYEAAADILARAGDEVLAVALSMPSYEGRLSGPARAVGYEIQHQCRDAGGCLQRDAQALQTAARAFEEADRQSVETFAHFQSILSIQNPDAPVLDSPGLSTRGGNEEFGYTYLSRDYVVIWCHGKYMRVNLNVPPLTSDGFRKTMDLIEHINKFDALLQSIPDQYRGLVEDACVTIFMLLCTPVPIVGVAALLGVFWKLFEEIKDCKEICETFQKLIKESGKIAEEYSDLYASNDPGIEAQKDASVP
jgi:uncharacterized protein YukE